MIIQKYEVCEVIYSLGIVIYLFIFSACSPLGVLQKQNHATDQEKEKLNPCENTECPNVNALRDINFQVAKVSLMTWEPLFSFCI